MNTKKRQKKPSPPPTINPAPGVAVYESFSTPWGLADNMRAHREPSCFNGILNLRKVRITVEVLDEPKEVLIERLRKLWLESENSHEWGPMKQAAEALGIELSHDEQWKARMEREAAKAVKGGAL